jgi:lyso-ornithine lipid O-acyltransferase
MLGLGHVTVRVIFHPPITVEQYGTRKELAAHCYKVIAAGLSAALAGRGPGDVSEIEAEPEELMAEAE